MIICCLSSLYYVNLLLTFNHSTASSLLRLLPALIEMTFIFAEVANCAQMLLMLTFLLRMICFVVVATARELRRFLRSLKDSSSTCSHFSNPFHDHHRQKRGTSPSLAQLAQSEICSIVGQSPSPRSSSARLQPLPLYREAVLSLQLARFRREHLALVRLIQIADSALFSRVILVFFLGNIPFNVYFIAFVYRNADRLHVDTAVVVAFLAVYIVAAMIAAATVAYTSETLHRFAPQLVAGQMALGGGGGGGGGGGNWERFSGTSGQRCTERPKGRGRSLRLKIKLLVHYELVHSSAKISFTVGSIGPITKFAIFNVRE